MAKEFRLVPDVVLQFQYGDDRTKTLRFRALNLAVWEELWTEFGLTPALMMDRFAASSGIDPVVLAVWIWLERRQRERNLTWKQARRDVETLVSGDGFDFALVGVTIDGKAWGADEDDEDEGGGGPAAEEPAVDPTQAEL